MARSSGASTLVTMCVPASISTSFCSTISMATARPSCCARPRRAPPMPRAAMLPRWATVRRFARPTTARAMWVPTACPRWVPSTSRHSAARRARPSPPRSTTPTARAAWAIPRPRPMGLPTTIMATLSAIAATVSLPRWLVSTASGPRRCSAEDTMRPAACGLSTTTADT